MNKTQIISVIALMLFACTAFAQSTFNAPLKIRIYTEANPNNLNLTTTPLRYGKSVAYSLTLDDGWKNAFTIAFPFLSGNSYEVDGITQPASPISYTDGCGNSQAFTAGLSINSVNSSGIDIHTGEITNNLTWADMQQMYDANWDILNHSYSHNAGIGAPLPDTTYQSEVANNQSYIASQINNYSKGRTFVVPSGDTNYYPFAWEAGHSLVANQFFQADNPYGYQLKNLTDTVNFLVNRFTMFNEVFNHYDLLNLAFENATSEEPLWFADYTHSVNTVQAASVLHNQFRPFMEYVSNTYGTGGSDEVWGASLEEVWEYQIMRLYTSFEVIIINEQEGYVELSIDLTKIPGDMRRYALSLQATSLVSGVELVNCANCNVCFGEKDNGSIINLDLTGSDIIPENSLGVLAKNAATLLIPNPATHSFEIQNKQATNIAVYNLRGQLMIRQASAAQAISVESLEAAIYLIQYELNGQIGHSKLIVK